MKNYEDCIIFLLAKAYQKAHGDFKKRISGFGLTPIQHLILEALWEEDGLSAGDIGKKLVLDAATLSGVLERMTAGGWILKKTDPQDKRIQRVYLSRKARNSRPKLAKERDQANENILSKLNLEEKLLLRRFLRDVQG